MPAKYDRCVRKVQKSGKSKSSSHAICTAAGLRGKKHKGKK